MLQFQNAEVQIPQESEQPFRSKVNTDRLR